MRKLNATQILVALAVLVNLVWLIDDWSWSKQSPPQQKDRRDDLYRKYDQYPFNFTNDFNGDGIPDRLFVEQQTPKSQNEVVVQDSNARDLLRLPYSHGNSTFRTHVAVYQFGSTQVAHILLYDGVNYSPPRKAVFGWDSESGKFVEMKPLPSEQNILNSLAAHDDSGERHSRVIKDDMMWLRHIFYALSLIILFGIYWHQKSSTRGGSLPAQP